MKYAVVTFGCRVNQADSLNIEDDLQARGVSPTTPEQADIVVVNTCSVTASADQAARQSIRRLTRINPGVRIVVTGCYATRRPEDIRELPGVVSVIDNEHKPRLIPLALASLGPLRTTAERFDRGDGPCGLSVEPGVAGRTAFTLRVQTGCDEACAYCIIPSTRGTSRSVPIADVLRDVERAWSAGFKEIALTGVHLGSYGRDLDPSSSLLDLLQTLARHGESAGRRVRLPEFRFRVSSLEPMDCSAEIVELLASSPAFAAHLHLPLQHASDRMLTAMRRPYSIAYYEDLVRGIRSRVPDASIGTDVIVGFPGERDHDFDQLANFLERSPLTHVHVFPYSDRPGTEAAALSGRVDGPTVRQRAQQLRRISETLSARFRQSQIGHVQRALTIDDGSVAVTGNYLKVQLPRRHGRNEWVDVELTGVSPLTGEIRN